MTETKFKKLKKVKKVEKILLVIEGLVGGVTDEKFTQKVIKADVEEKENREKVQNSWRAKDMGILPHNPGSDRCGAAHTFQHSWYLCPLQAPVACLRGGAQ